MENNNFNNSSISSENIDNLVVLGDEPIITALFRNPRTAETAYAGLREKGYKGEEIDLAMSEHTHNIYFSDIDTSDVDTSDNPSFGNKSVEGLGIGAAIGGSLGAIGAALAALGTSLVIPALGVVVSGSLAASLAGAGAGVAAGGLIGSLVGLGIPNDQARILDEGLKKGGVVIAVKAKSETERQELNRQWSDLQRKDGFTQAA